MVAKKNYKNSELKCFINTAKNGAKYRACLPKKKKPYSKHQDERENPHPANKRKQPRQLAYPERPRNKASTHRMANGDIHTGAKHTKDSKLVKKAPKKLIIKPKPKAVKKNIKVVSFAKPKNKLKIVPSVKKAQAYKQKLGKTIKEMTDEEKREYGRLRTADSRAKAKKKASKKK